MFEKTKYFIIDLDGTFYVGDTLIPGADVCLRRIEQAGRDYCFFSNNSSHSVGQIRARLKRMGFPVPREKVLLSSYVCAEYILREYPGRTVYLLGNAYLRACMRQMGVPLTERDPDIVLAGFDTQLTYARVRDACLYLQRGAVFLATHADLKCSVPGGFIPDAGSILAMLTACTQRQPTVIGKPMQPTVEYLTQKLGCRCEELVFVGDRLETDIRIGVDYGAPTVLVMTGVTDENTLRASQIRPTLTLPSLADLSAYLE